MHYRVAHKTNRFEIRLIECFQLEALINDIYVTKNESQTYYFYNFTLNTKKDLDFSLLHYYIPETRSYVKFVFEIGLKKFLFQQIMSE